MRSTMPGNTNWHGLCRTATSQSCVAGSFRAAWPLRYAIVEGMGVRDSRVYNYPPRWNGAPSQELLVIRRNHKTGEISLDPFALGPHSLLVPGSDRRAQADQRQVRDRA